MVCLGHMLACLRMTILSTLSYLSDDDDDQELRQVINISAR